MEENGNGPRQRRHAPGRDERQRDPERSRELLLNAALDEFSAKGFAGARVQDIARRAGVNKQLISYYFGGKEGLYRAIERRWLEQETTFAQPDISFEDLIVEYLRANLEDPRMLRLLIWNGLSDPGIGDDADKAANAAEDVSDLKRRQETGEIAGDFDPALLQLALMGAIAAPIIMPQVVRRLTGLGYDSREFQRAYAEELRRIVRRLAA